VKKFRPLLLQELDIRMPGVRLRRLRVNRHLPETETLSSHEHRHSQILCYLGGRGTMITRMGRRDVGPGAVTFLPPRSLHAFEESAGRRPLSLVLDLDLRGAARGGIRFAQMTAASRGLVQRELSVLTRLKNAEGQDNRLVVGSAVLRIVETLLRDLAILPPSTHFTPPVIRQFERIVRKSELSALTVAAIAGELGYQPDYLSRLMKQHTGMTAIQYRDVLVVERAKRALKTAREVQDACQQLGFFDQNYFSRWFKKCTGQTPNAYRRSGAAAALPRA